MTPAVRKFVERFSRHQFKRVLELGSLDVNGSIRSSFTDCNFYLGIDLRFGPNVDVIYDATKLNEILPPENFDCVISLEALEHCANWRAFIEQGWSCLRRDGLFILTMAAPHKAYHAEPDDYWRFTHDDLATLFQGQKLLAAEQLGVSVGVACRKCTDELTSFNLVIPKPITKRIPVVKSPPTG